MNVTLKLNFHVGIQHFLLFQQCFLSYKRQFSLFEQEVMSNLQSLSILDQAKILVFGKGLREPDQFINCRYTITKTYSEMVNWSKGNLTPKK